MSNEFEFKKLISKRRSIKAQLTIFQRFIDDINDENLCSVKAQLETKLESLKERKNQFDELRADFDFLTGN